MSVNFVDPPTRSPRSPRSRSNFSTDLFTGLNIAAFVLLAASVVAAGFLYSQGA
jgi:hypothetical protein